MHFILTNNVNRVKPGVGKAIGPTFEKKIYSLFCKLIGKHMRLNIYSN